jgi:hypothetical protein
MGGKANSYLVIVSYVIGVCRKAYRMVSPP